MKHSRETLLRVLIFSPDPGLEGGVAEFGQTLKRKLSPDIAASWFLTGRRPGMFGIAFRNVMPLFDAIQLAARLLTQRHDVYHLNPSFVPRSLLRDGIFLIVLWLFQKRQILVFFRGWDTDYFHHILGSTVRRRMFRLIYGRASRILVLGSDFARDLSALGLQPQRIHTSTTMFDGALFENANRRREGDDIQILFLARLIAAKGVYELLEAFRQVSATDSRLVLVMAGDGVEKTRARQWCIEKGLESKVHFVGYVRNGNKAQVLLDSDMFILPSFHGEGCPNALLEAMGAGLPVIVTPVGGIPDIVQDQVNGFIVPARSVPDLKTAIRKLADNPDIRRKMGAINRERAWNRYEANVVVTDLERYYRMA